MLTPKQEKAITELLAKGTVKDAAQATGVNPATLFRWLQEAEFQKRLREAQRQVVNGAIGALQAATIEAVETLRRNLTCGNAFAENSAAIAILDKSFKAIELDEIAERVKCLEQLLEQKEGKRQWR